MAAIDQDLFSTTRECTAELHELPELVSFAREFFAKAAGPDADSMLLFNLELAVSEACTNVIKYAYPKDSPGRMRMDLGAGPGTLVIRIRDSGAAFDPCQFPDPNLDNPKESGLGIFFVRELMDVMHYRREGDENILELAKSF